MSTKRKPSKSPKKSYRTFARSSCASPSVISAGANKKKRYSAQSPESGACILSSSDSSESPSGERESGGTPLKTVGTPTRLSPLNSAGYQSPSSDNGDAIHPNFAESNKSVIGRHGNAHLLPPGFPDSVAEQTAEFPQLAGQTSSQPLPGKEEKSKTFQNQPSTDSSEDFVLHKKARRSRKHRPRLRGSSDDDSPGKNPFATGRRHAFSSESSEDDVLTSKKPTMTPKRHPGWSDSSDSEENSGEAKGPPNQLRTGQKKSGRGHPPWRNHHRNIFHRMMRVVALTVHPAGDLCPRQGKMQTKGSLRRCHGKARLATGALFLANWIQGSLKPHCFPGDLLQTRPCPRWWSNHRLLSLHL